MAISTFNTRCGVYLWNNPRTLSDALDGRVSATDVASKVLAHLGESEAHAPFYEKEAGRCVEGFRESA